MQQTMQAKRENKTKKKKRTEYAKKRKILNLKRSDIGTFLSDEYERIFSYNLVLIYVFRSSDTDTKGRYDRAGHNKLTK